MENELLGTASLTKHRAGLFSLLFLVLFACSCKDHGPVSSSGGDDERTLQSLARANSHPFYTMKFYGDYGFAQHVGLAKGEPVSSVGFVKNTDSSWGCTCFVAYGSSSNPQFGRNFDWHDCIPILLFTNPPNGYASLSMVDIEYLGYNRSNLPDDEANRAALLRAPWYPFDGMNEKGVTVGMMAIPAAQAPYDPRKISLGELEAIRLVLDFASSTDEAIALLGKYNIPMEDPPIHYLIADPSGRSAVVEFINGTMSVLRNGEPWHVSTNFIITGSGAPANSSCWRYNTAYSELRAASGAITSDGALDLLRKVSQPSTIWSIVYELGTGTAHVATDRWYDSALQFVLKDNLPAK